MHQTIATSLFLTSSHSCWQYIRDKAFDKPPTNPDEDGTYVLWWHRTKPFKSAVLRQVVDLVQWLLSENDGSTIPHHFDNRTGSTTPYRFDKWRTRKWKTREEREENLRQGAGKPITLYVSNSYPPYLRDALRAAFEYHKDFLGKNTSVKDIEQPGAVRVLCLYGRGGGGETHGDFFENRQLLEDTQQYFAQRRKAIEDTQKHSGFSGSATSLKYLISAGEQAHPAAVLLYSAAEPFSFFLDRNRELDLDTKIVGFGEPIWDLWPQDVMMQRVAAKEALKKLKENAQRTLSAMSAGWRMSVLAKSRPKKSRPVWPSDRLATTERSEASRRG